MTKIQDIQTEQNTNPIAIFWEYYVKIKNYKVKSIKDLSNIPTARESKDIKTADIEYDYLSGDAFRIGEAINILKSQYNSLYKINVFLPNLHFEVGGIEKNLVSIACLTIQSEFTPKALEPIVGSILKNVYVENLHIQFKSRDHFGSEVPVPVASYIFYTFEEYFSTPERIDFMEKYVLPNYYSFYLGGNVLINMDNKLLKYDYGYEITSAHTIEKKLKDFTTQELLKATLITKDLNKYNSILKKLPDDIIKKIFFEHVGAQELGLIANRGKIEINNYIKAKEEFKTINDKKLVIKQYKELIEQKRLNEKIKQQHSSEVGRLKQEHKEVELQHSSEVVRLKQEHKEAELQHSSEVDRLKLDNKLAELQHSSEVAQLRTEYEEAVQKFNDNTIDACSTFMLLNEHFGDKLYQNKNTTYIVELGIASVLRTEKYINGMSYEYSLVPLVRAGAFIAKDASYSQKESIKQKLSQYLPTESYSDEVDLSLNFVFDLAIAYASPNFSMSLLVSGANSVSNYLEASFGSDYVMTTTNCLSNAIGGGMALLFALRNEHVLMGANKYPIYSVVSTLLGTKYIYEISNTLSAKALDLVGITPENVVERIEAVKEHAIDIMNTGECVMWEESSLSVDGNQLNDASQPMHCKLDANLDHYHNLDIMMHSNFM